MQTFDRRKLAGVAVLSLFALVVGLLLVTPRDASGQQPPRAPAADDQPGRGGGRAFMRMMMPRLMGGAAIAVADGKVFVVAGGTLYKFDAETLELEGQNTFIEPPAPGGFGMGRGAFGDAGRFRGPRGAPPAPPAAEPPK